MRRVRYSVAMSLDGYIAGPQGEADWIEMDPSLDVAAFFRDFYAQFDVAIMGRRTYEVFGGAVEGMATYVFSRTLPPGPRNGVTVLGEGGLSRLAELRAGESKGHLALCDRSSRGTPLVSNCDCQLARARQEARSR